MSKKPKKDLPESWHVLVIGLPLKDQEYDLGESLKIRRLIRPLTVFDLAEIGSVGFREWATLEPLASAATAEIISPTATAKLPGYDALNKCWLASAMLVLRGFARHICPAVSGYSWNFVAGHQEGKSKVFRKQMMDEGVRRSVYHPRHSLPPFQGGLLEYHLELLLPSATKSTPLDATEAIWIASHYEKFNLLAAKDERFRFGLEAAIDWRYVKDPRAAISRIWSGIESLFGIKSELVYRISLLISTVIACRGSQRVDAFKKCKRIYNLRSKAVHGSAVDGERLMTGVFESYEILRALLIDAVERGTVREEDDYVKELLC